jgi:CrcB protein
VGLSLAGGLGAAARFVVDGAVRGRIRWPYPFGTTVVNVSGSLLLGFVMGLVLGQGLGAEWGLVLGTGFLGGYTTFSTASFETVRLLQQRRYAAAFANGAGMLVTAVAAAALGLWLATLVTG